LAVLNRLFEWSWVILLFLMEVLAES